MKVMAPFARLSEASVKVMAPRGMALLTQVTAKPNDLFNFAKKRLIFCRIFPPRKGAIDVPPSWKSDTNEFI